MGAGLTVEPVASAMMLIRRPVEEVFEAFVNPDITTKFWFTKSSGRLESGERVEWSWEMYGVSVPVEVKTVVPSTKISIEWGDQSNRTSVEWTFKSLGELGTFVKVVNSGFQGSADEVVAKVNDSAGGFNLLLAGAKAWLEHRLQLNLVHDHVPVEVRACA
jgi:uncharacterized protein YndB with AHSA1/START domain